MTVMPTSVAAVAAGVLGACVGSFLNVVIWRVPRGESVVRPGSRCPSCGTALRAADNVPVLAWLALRGRCRTCEAPISARYPVVEATTALLFGVATAVLIANGRARLVPAVLWLVATLVAETGITVDHGRPNARVAAVGAAGAAVLVLAAAL